MQARALARERCGKRVEARILGPSFERHRKLWAAEPPDANIQYLLYQTLVGAWPIEKERVKAYIEKAAREAKSRTSWTAPQAAYETALQGFVDAVLADETFRRELESFVGTVRDAGRTSSLAQVLLKLTCPGVPDIYQGTELRIGASSIPTTGGRWIRPTTPLLGELEGLPVAKVMARADEAPKLLPITRALACAARGRAFGPDGAYEPLAVEGRFLSRGRVRARRSRHGGPSFRPSAAESGETRVLLPAAPGATSSGEM
jgi:(1->4)-alpha-D-glucan 1-alpha-D-glucosylmutase